ncbi:AMP-binding protein [Massilia sp. H6]|uniref:AMP-binding enzyme n=1 Tax=Massilia sp. H6 TaxID=2970464 RepID=UPI0021681F7C|nr:AMP-binding protein [Massilia sp. H6]UVW26963.1 AMP-binding protein [Massilia sp. H6]
MIPITEINALDAIPAPWWRDRATLLRVVADLLAAELALMRPGLPRRRMPWSADLDLASDLGADSLELLGLASVLEQMLSIGCIGQERVLAHPRLGAWADAVAAGLEGGAELVNFRTSGSSGAPKTCRHALAELWQESVALARLFPGTRRILSMVPSHHIYGFLFSVLLPRALGLEPGLDGDIELATVADLRAESPGAVARQLRPGDLVIGHPDFWRAFAAAATHLPDDVVGVSSTAPCPADVANAVAAAGVARLVQVYGSSETAGVGWRDSPDEDYRLFPYWEAGAEPKRAAGASPGPAVLTRRCADGSRRSYPLQDSLVWSTPGRFRPAGRIDHAVQVGGTNVYPGYVAEVLGMHPQVAQAAVRLMRADEGQRLKAFVVTHASSTGDMASLRAGLGEWMAQRLSTPECPAAYSFGPALPRQANGKLCDWIIEAWE